MLFDWYRKDFSSSPAGLLNWVALRLPASLSAQLTTLAQRKEFKISFEWGVYGVVDGEREWGGWGSLWIFCLVAKISVRIQVFLFKTAADAFNKSVTAVYSSKAKVHDDWTHCAIANVAY